MGCFLKGLALPCAGDFFLTGEENKPKKKTFKNSFRKCYLLKQHEYINELCSGKKGA